MVHDPVEQGHDKFVLSSMFNVHCQSRRKWYRNYIIIVV